jgi:ribosomal-protein-serine acetyltransferase
MSREPLVSKTRPAPALTVPPRASFRRRPPETPRLVLLPIECPDAGELWQAIEGSRWHLERWLPWVPFNATPDACERYAEACEKDWDAGRALRLAIRDRQTRELYGVVGLDNIVHLHRSCELGYWLKREATGQGLMGEAARAALRIAFDQLGVHRIRCAAATENYASLKVISGLGFRFEGIARQVEYVASRWLDHALFAKLSTDDTDA